MAPSLGERVFQYVMTEHRSLVVAVFVLPLSLLWDTYIHIRVKLYMWMNSAPSQHAARVQRVCAQVRARPAGKRMASGRPGWQSISLSYRTYKTSSHCIDAICDMIDIISVDTKACTVKAEPLVNMGQLTRELLPRGFTLPIVPEMDDLTVGGLVNGTGIESSSHRYGLFHEQCVAFEVCLADGTVVNATADNENADLFHALPWSYGTIGIVCSVTMRLIPCKPYVRLTYTPFASMKSGCDHFAALSNPGDSQPDFVESLAFSATELVVMAGELVDAPGYDGPVNSISLWYKPWFFKHVETKLLPLRQSPAKVDSAGAATVEYIPLRDYYHRHSKSMFWEMELMLPVGNVPIVRLLLGWMLPPKISFLKLTQTEMTRRLTQETHVAQDFMLPMSELANMMAFDDHTFGQVYPVWMCPHIHRPMPGSIMVPPQRPGSTDGLDKGSEMYVDVGVYGLPQCVKDKPVGHGFDMKKAMRAAEAHLRKVGGVQMLYGDIFATRAEFELMYPHAEYRKLRTKYGAVGAFPEVYDKINVILSDEEKEGATKAD